LELGNLLKSLKTAKTFFGKVWRKKG
jgi:hypothetical protein